MGQSRCGEGRSDETIRGNCWTLRCRGPTTSGCASCGLPWRMSDPLDERPCLMDCRGVKPSNDRPSDGGRHGPSTSASPTANLVPPWAPTGVTPPRQSTAAARGPHQRRCPLPHRTGRAFIELRGRRRPKLPEEVASRRPPHPVLPLWRQRTGQRAGSAAGTPPPPAPGAARPASAALMRCSCSGAWRQSA